MLHHRCAMYQSYGINFSHRSIHGRNRRYVKSTFGSLPTGWVKWSTGCVAILFICVPHNYYTFSAFYKRWLLQNVGVSAALPIVQQDKKYSEKLVLSGKRSTQNTTLSWVGKTAKYQVARTVAFFASKEQFDQILWAKKCTSF